MLLNAFIMLCQVIIATPGYFKKLSHNANLECLREAAMCVRTFQCEWIYLVAFSVVNEEKDLL
jgi:hypothetical protein